jgi:hypothetical protein
MGPMNKIQKPSKLLLFFSLISFLLGLIYIKTSVVNESMRGTHLNLKGSDAIFYGYFQLFISTIFLIIWLKYYYKYYKSIDLLKIKIFLRYQLVLILLFYFLIYMLINVFKYSFIICFITIILLSVILIKKRKNLN